MPEFWITAKDTMQGGTTVVVDKPAIWAEPIAEFNLPVVVSTPLSASVFVSAQEDGFLVRGSMQGAVTVPCSRCAEDSTVDIAHSFDSFEPFPPAEDEANDKNGDEADLDQDESVVRLSPYGPELNLAALLWQEFMLAVPVKVLCSPQCKGLCPRCGENLNIQPCACPSDDGDPRMAALRNLKLAR